MFSVPDKRGNRKSEVPGLGLPGNATYQACGRRGRRASTKGSLSCSAKLHRLFSRESWRDRLVGKPSKTFFFRHVRLKWNPEY
jgi:hypothetical protein